MWLKLTFDPFSSSLSITWSWIVRKLIFDPPSWVRTGSKVSCRSVWKRIKSGFSNKLSHMLINFEEKLEWIKSDSACICSTWLTSFTYVTGSKVGPLRTYFSSKSHFYGFKWKIKNLGINPTYGMSHTSSWIFKQTLETILSWKPSKSNPQYYVINIAPTAKSCGRFHKEPIRYESSRDLSHHMIFSLMTFSWF